MPKTLTRNNKFFHFINGERVDGKNKEMRGDCSGLSGDCSYLRGDCSGLFGNCTGLCGDCSDLSGNFDDITIKERKADPNIGNYIKK